MDLLDLYHAHDYSLSTTDDEQVINQHSEIAESQEGKHRRKTRIVPWEPYKAATTTANRKSDQCPEKLPELIAYAIGNQKRVKPDNNENCDELEIRTENENRGKPEKSELELHKEIQRLNIELGLEQKVNAELKKLMVATLSDELQGQVEALTSDKIRLARRVDEYMGKLIVEDEEADMLRIDRDVWKCKFLAQSIRCDELTSKNEYLLRLLLGVQGAIRGGRIQEEDIHNYSKIDLQPLFHRSPCDFRIKRVTPKYSNITISCCPNCTGREIHLL